MSDRWTVHKRTGLTEMRPYVPGEDLAGVSVSPEDKPREGGWVARDSYNPNDRWYVAESYYKQNYEEVTTD